MWTESVSAVDPPNLDDVLHRRDMLCFGHDWTGDPLSKTHLMREFAKDNRVLWINSIGYRAPSASRRDLSRAVDKLRRAATPVKEVERNIFVLNPLAIPAYGLPAVRAINKALLRFQVRRAMNQLGFVRPINWVFNPTAAVVAGALGEALVIYYCVDEFTAFAGVPPQLVALEDSLIERADLVIVSSEALRKTKSQRSRRTVLVRHGVAWDHFRKALLPETPAAPEVATLPRPVIGYFGLMADDWIDLDLLVHVAKHFSTGSLVLLGKVTMDLSPLLALPNVHLLGRKPFAALPSYCKAFDVAINPFPINEVTRNSNPLKVREYLAAGLPVVSTRIPEVEVVAGVRIADTTEGFVDAITEALAHPGPSASVSDALRGERWEAKADEVRRAVARIEHGE